MKLRRLLLSLLILLFACCQSPGHKIIATTKSTNTLIDSQKYEEQDQAGDTGCVRGAAESILNKSVFPNSRFELQRDGITGIETAALNNGETLKIRNWGCEYYCLTFRFETTRFQADTMNLKYWYEKAVLLMNEVKEGVNDPIAQEGIRALKNYVDTNTSTYEELKLKYEINFGDKDIRSFATLDRIQKLSDSTYAVEVTFSVGPL